MTIQFCIARISIVSTKNTIRSRLIPAQQRLVTYDVTPIAGGTKTMVNYARREKFSNGQS